MVNLKKLSTILFLDIETVPAEKDYSLLQPIIRQEWDKKATRLNQIENAIDPAKFYFNNAGIYAEFGKIICISIGKLEIIEGEKVMKTKSFYGDNETSILEQFFHLINKNPQYSSFCGHNIKEFDIPYICRRGLINGLELPKILQVHGKKSYELDFLLDTLQLWKFGDYKHYTSLNLLATLFNIESSKIIMDGSKVGAAYYFEYKLELIKTYCQHDVSTVMQLFLKLNSFSIVEKNNIHHQ
jgi:predicted PolB exonuclease-like 3'-5' exonuclease